MYRKELFTGALMLGVALVVVMVLQYMVRGMGVGIIAALLSLAGFVVIVVAQLRYGRSVARLHEGDGFGLGRAFLFMIQLSALAGVVYGLGAYVMQEVVDPAYYSDLMNNMVQAYVKSLGMTTEQAAAFDSPQTRAMMGKVWVVVLSGVFGMVFQGGLIALFTSAIVRRRPASPINKTE